MMNVRLNAIFLRFILLTLLSGVFSQISAQKAASKAQKKVFYSREFGFYYLGDALTETIQIPLSYEEVYQFKNDYAIVKQNGKYGVIDTVGKEVVSVDFDMVSRMEDNYFRVQKGGKYGVSDINNKLIVPILYDKVDKASRSGYFVCRDSKGVRFIDLNGVVKEGALFEDCDILMNGRAFVIKNSKYGMADLSGNIVVPIAYDSVSILGHPDARMIAVAKGGKWGLINTKNEQLLPCRYDKKITFGAVNVAWIDSGELTAAVNDKGRFVIPFGDYLNMAALKTGLIAVYEMPNRLPLSILITIYNNNGDVISMVYYNPNYENNGLNRYPELYEHSKGFYTLGLQKVDLGTASWSTISAQFFDLSGKKVNSTSTSGIYGYDSADRTGYFWSQGEGGVGFYLLDTIGRPLVKTAFKEAGSENNGFSIVRADGLGMVNAKGLVIPAEYDHIFRISENAFAVNKGGVMNSEERVTGGKWGVYNLQGKLIIPVMYRELYMLNDKAFMVGTGSAYGAVNLTGKLFIDTVYQMIHWVSSSPDMYAVNKGGFFDPNAGFMGGKWGFADASGRLVYPVTGDRVTAFESGRAWVFTEDKWSMIRTDGTKVPGESYTNIGNSGNGLTPVMKKDKWGFADVNNTVVIKPVYTNTSTFSDGVCVVQDASSSKLGVINTKGQYLIQPEYDELLAVKNGYFKFSKNGALFIFDKTGKALSTFLTK